MELLEEGWVHLVVQKLAGLVHFDPQNALDGPNIRRPSTVDRPATGPGALDGPQLRRSSAASRLTTGPGAPSKTKKRPMPKHQPIYERT